MEDYHHEKNERTEDIGQNRKKLNELQIQMKTPKVGTVREQINDLEKKYKNIKREMSQSTSKRKDLENELANLHDDLKKIDGERLEQEKLQFTNEHSKIEYEK